MTSDSLPFIFLTHFDSTNIDWLMYTVIYSTYYDQNEYTKPGYIAISNFGHQLHGFPRWIRRNATITGEFHFLFRLLLFFSIDGKLKTILISMRFCYFKHRREYIHEMHQFAGYRQFTRSSSFRTSVKLNCSILFFKKSILFGLNAF